MARSAPPYSSRAASRTRPLPTVRRTSHARQRRRVPLFRVIGVFLLALLVFTLVAALTLGVLIKRQAGRDEARPSDAIVVLCLTLWMIPKPLRNFGAAVKEVLGESAGPQTLAKWRTTIHEALEESPFSLVEVAVTKLGRSHFAVAYIRPETPVAVEVLDATREAVALACRSVHDPSRMEIIYTAKDPYA